jgi:hypothetical protein
VPQQPLNSKEVAEIEYARKRELLRKVRETRSNALQEKGRVRSADPAKQLNPAIHYAWVNRNEHRIVFFQALGYKIVNDAAVMTDWKREDGSHAYGDLILMEIDKETHEMMKLDSQLRALEGVEGESVFASFAQRAGIPVEVPRRS